MLAGTSPAMAIPAPAPPPSTSPGASIVAKADSQLGTDDNPAGTYCNQYSAYWLGPELSECGSTGNYSEEWCADFAVWVWRQAGVDFIYGYDTADGNIDAAAASFYYYGEANGTWHASGSGYPPQPGDVVVYGMNFSTGVADHVAIVTSQTSGDAGPNVVNGDWWVNGNGGVVAANDETTVTGSDAISGYVSPAS
jgi:hypothetical protein